MTQALVCQDGIILSRGQSKRCWEKPEEAHHAQSALMADITFSYHPASSSLDAVVGNDEIREDTSSITPQNHDTPDSSSRSVKDSD